MQAQKKSSSDEFEDEFEVHSSVQLLLLFPNLSPVQPPPPPSSNEFQLNLHNNGTDRITSSFTAFYCHIESNKNNIFPKLNSIKKRGST